MWVLCCKIRATGGFLWRRREKNGTATTPGSAWGHFPDSLWSPVPA